MLASLTTAVRAGSDSGALARSDQALQNLPSSWLMPLSEGSAKASSACSSDCDFVAALPSCMLSARYWMSRKLSRMRRIASTSTPVPSCAP